MANVKVKALKNHYIKRHRTKGDVYLMDENMVTWCANQGYVKLVPKKKKTDEVSSTDK